jgi:hypothetical protein
MLNKFIFFIYKLDYLKEEVFIIVFLYDFYIEFIWDQLLSHLLLHLYYLIHNLHGDINEV